MASCFDISIIDAWNTGDENVTNGSVDDYDFEWGSGTDTPQENPPCNCRNTCRNCQPAGNIQEDETEEEEPEAYPIVQL